MSIVGQPKNSRRTVTVVLALLAAIFLVRPLVFEPLQTNIGAVLTVRQSAAVRNPYRFCSDPPPAGSRSSSFDALVTAALQTDRGAPNAFLRAAAHRLAGNYRDAARLLLPLRSEDSRYYLRALMLADVHCSLGEDEAAATYLGKVRAGWLAFRRINGELNAGRVDEAERFYQLALLAQPGIWNGEREDVDSDSGHLLSAGHLNLRLNRLADAEHWYTLAISVAPSRSEPVVALGRLMLLQGRLAEAIWFLEQAVALDPFNAYLRLELGDVYLQSGDAAQATKEWISGIRVVPHSSQIGTVLIERLRIQSSQCFHARDARQDSLACGIVESLPQQHLDQILNGCHR